MSHPLGFLHLEIVVEEEATEMQAGSFERLVELMRRLAEGDRAALWVLLEEFGAAIRGSVRRHLDHLGVTATAEALDELTLETVLMLGETAAGWRPDGGALPWVWAERRVRRLVSAWVGQHHDTFDAERHDRGEAEPVPSVVDDDETETLRLVALTRPQAALLQLALEVATTARERAILLAYTAQKVDGDPSPANTLAARFGVTPPNVRQIVKRARDKTRRVIGSDARFAALIDLPLFG